jgi:hypothetical protein
LSDPVVATKLTCLVKVVLIAGGDANYYTVYMHFELGLARYCTLKLVCGMAIAHRPLWRIGSEFCEKSIFYRIEASMQITQVIARGEGNARVRRNVTA